MKLEEERRTDQPNAFETALERAKCSAEMLKCRVPQEDSRPMLSRVSQPREDPMLGNAAAADLVRAGSCDHLEDAPILIFYKSPARS
jgi:hypothetical protein